jgi:hypothetical protein
MAGSHNCGTQTPNKQQQKTLVRSKGWLAPNESFEFAVRDELKKIKLAHQGCQPVTAD